MAPTGRVVGVDISAAMLEPARRRVAAAGLDNVELLEADAQVHRFEAGSFDAVISRFGMMFFEDPEAAFANLARALRPGGRLSFVCPQDPLKSEWVAIALGAAVARWVGRPNLGAPGAAGAFAFADGDRLTRLLTAGGFREVRLETVTRPQRVGDALPMTRPASSCRCQRASSSSPAPPRRRLTRPSRLCVPRLRPTRIPG